MQCAWCGKPAEGYLAGIPAGALQYFPSCRKCPANPKALISLDEIFYQHRRDVGATARVLGLTEEQTASLLAHRVDQNTSQFVSTVTQVRARFDSLRQELERQANEARQLLADLTQFQILNESDLHLAAKLTQKASTTWKGLEEQRKEYLKPLSDFVKTVNALVKLPVDVLKEIERVGKAKMEEALTSCKESQDNILAALEMDPVNKDQLMEQARSLEWGLPSEISLRDHLEIEVVDMDILPSMYCDPNLTRIREAIMEARKYGLTAEIPGVKHWTRDKIAVYREGNDE